MKEIARQWAEIPGLSDCAGLDFHERQAWKVRCPPPLHPSEPEIRNCLKLPETRNPKPVISRASTSMSARRGRSYTLDLTPQGLNQNCPKAELRRPKTDTKRDPKLPDTTRNPKPEIAPCLPRALGLEGLPSTRKSLGGAYHTTACCLPKGAGGAYRRELTKDRGSC